jgi:uncharacterized protein (TIGR00730 family)
MSNKVITSFGSAFTKPSEQLYRDAEEIGKIIAKKNWNVCSGGYFGTMEAISMGAKSAGGKTIGVTVKGWDAVTNRYIDEEIKMPNLMERIVELIGIADAFVVFKGGTGTLVEISVALELMNKKAMKEKTMIFYTDFWKGMIDILKQDSDYLKSLIQRNVRFINQPDELNSILV